jgi:hypothetical protein
LLTLRGVEGKAEAMVQPSTMATKNRSARIVGGKYCMRRGRGSVAGSRVCGGKVKKFFSGKAPKSPPVAAKASNTRLNFAAVTQLMYA